MLARDLELRLDPAALMFHAGMPPDPWQEQLLRSRSKTEVTAAMALHDAAYVPGSLVLLLSPSLRQSQELYRRVTDYRSRLGNPWPVKEESALRIEFKNGSRIVALPGTEETIRGYGGVRLLVVDEAARVPNALYLSVRPMLAVSGGRLVCLTTPFGKRGFFYEAWTGPEAWDRVRITAEECPRISREFLAEERRSLGDWWFDQEYLCMFTATNSQLFRDEDIQAAFTEDVEPLFPDRLTGGDE